ncbi:HTH-type transcriptional regulator EthR [Rugosimonospora africana]|uniref:HTH-type transcriptional regulator EthR n=1 Tax=Rugosimonospora africana TaxID=556532 RepID=A0A8J3VNC6_9ACTN|nr:HTH-type transcriptional regulator EthR [Rugosimonospora africana]
MRERLLDATRDLLAHRRFDSISVADIIAAAGVSRASFYFYFPGKQAVLAELVRRAVDQGQQAAEPWTSGQQDPSRALRSGIEAGATLWKDNAGVLTAIVESWGSDEQLRELWLRQMETFTDATVARIQADPEVMRRLDGLDVRAVAASLTWLGERLYYLAAANVPPFTDRDILVDTLMHAWTHTLYGESPGSTTA